MNLTPKQEHFCQAYIETGNASEAYRQAYDAENMKPETVNRKAKVELDKGKIRARLDDLQKAHCERHDVNVDSLTLELEADRTLARKNDQANAAISATMGVAKLHGLLTDKVQHTGAIGLSGSPEWARVQVTLLVALAPYPEAKQAVLESLATLEAPDGE